MLTVGPMSWLRDLWRKAGHSPDQVWLFELLFNNKDIPVNLNRDPSSDRYLIEYRSKKVPLQVSIKDYWTRRRLQQISEFTKALEWASNPNDIVNQCQLAMRYRREIVQENRLGRSILSNLNSLALKELPVCSD